MTAPSHPQLAALEEVARKRNVGMLQSQLAGIMNISNANFFYVCKVRQAFGLLIVQSPPLFGRSPRHARPSCLAPRLRLCFADPLRRASNRQSRQASLRTRSVVLLPAWWRQATCVRGRGREHYRWLLSLARRWRAQSLEERGLVQRTPVMIHARNAQVVNTNVLHLVRYAPPVRLGPYQVFKVREERQRPAGALLKLLANVARWARGDVDTCVRAHADGGRGGARAAAGHGLCGLHHPGDRALGPMLGTCTPSGRYGTPLSLAAATLKRHTAVFSCQRAALA